jgi:haloacetate dehalogenase
VFVCWSGAGPPVLLLHGFPQTHLMWRGVAPVLARAFTVVCVAYRLALDHPGRVDRMAVLDIVATATVWDRADARFALAYWPWSLLAQPEPFPERNLAAAPDAIVDSALGGWGTPPTAFPPEARAAYIEALRDPAHIHAICEEYRAAATLDREHDEVDRAQGRRIAAPLLALWSAEGPLAIWYIEAGGPLALWRVWGDDVQGHSIHAGHFFPEEAPEETADALRAFFGRSP